MGRSIKCSPAGGGFYVYKTVAAGHRPVDRRADSSWLRKPKAGSQQPGGGPNQTSSKIDPVADANVVAAAPGSPVIADVGSSGAQEHDAQLVIPNRRQHV